jgi:hypothetical protein
MRERPLGVTIISALTVLLGLWTFCAGLVSFGWFGARFLGTIFGLSGPLGVGISSLFSVILGIAMILVGWGLWRMKHWAWLGAVAVLGVKAIFAIFALIGPANFDFIGTFISIVMLAYLMTPNIRLAFDNK